MKKIIVIISLIVTVLSYSNAHAPSLQELARKKFNSTNKKLSNLDSATKTTI